MHEDSILAVGIYYSSNDYYPRVCARSCLLDSYVCIGGCGIWLLLGYGLVVMRLIIIEWMWIVT